MKFDMNQLRIYVFQIFLAAEVSYHHSLIFVASNASKCEQSHRYIHVLTRY